MPEHEPLDVPWLKVKVVPATPATALPPEGVWQLADVPLITSTTSPSTKRLLGHVTVTLLPDFAIAAELAVTRNAKRLEKVYILGALDVPPQSPPAVVTPLKVKVLASGTAETTAPFAGEVQ